MSAIMKHDMKAILGEDFFKEEVRCEYRISEEMKRVFAVLLDLYMTFAEICDKHGLRYYVFSGMMLGAIRHKGFIPWDDDLDVAMPREDYNKFMQIAPQEVDYPYFVRTPYTDPDCYYSYIVLMNLSTSFIPKIFKNKPFKKGIPLDIFPLDYCDLEKYDQDREAIYKHVMRCGTWMKRGCKGLNKQQEDNFKIYHTDDPLMEWEKVQEIASNPLYKGSENVAISVLTTTEKEHLIFPTKSFEDYIMKPFEGINVRVPIGYEDLLVRLYGDWHKYPSHNDRGRKNDSIIFDPDTPYLAYMEE